MRIDAEGSQPLTGQFHDQVVTILMVSLSNHEAQLARVR